MDTSSRLSGNKLYDVAVIGGGPVGSRVAYQLAGMGFRVVVVEQRERLDEPVCCTGIIGRECISSFAIDDGIIQRWANSARIYSPSGKLVRVWRQQSQAGIVDRRVFNKALAERAMDRGAEYVLNSQVSEIEAMNEEVRIDIAGQADGADFFRARVVVIATGAGSRLVEKLGLGGVGDFVMGVQADVETKNIDEVEVYLGQYVAPGFFAWLVPTSPQRALVGLMSRHRPGPYLKKLMSSLVAQGKIVSDEVVLSYGRVPLKPLRRTYSERLVVVGGAAGQAKPTTGGGIYYGLLCADIAADVLHQAITSDALSAGSLSRYERRWKRKLGQEIRMGYWARKFYELLSDDRIDRIINIITSKGIDEALLKADDLSFDWHGGVVLRLLGHRALSRVIKAAKVPLPTGRGRKGSNTVRT